MRTVALIASLFASSFALMADTAQERLKAATDVFSEIMATPDKGIPQELLDSAYCAVIVPGLKKGAFIIGGQYGRGYMMCRKSSGVGWGDPAGVKIEGGSVGFQLGGSSTDLVMLVMNSSGRNDLLKSKFTIGASAEAAAGPVGRNLGADTGAYLKAELLTWSRTQGVFAGISLKGATLRPDKDANKELYGRVLTNREIVTSASLAPPAGAGPLIAALDKYSMRQEGAEHAARKKR